MKKKKIVSIILGIAIIGIAMIMPFHLKQICHEFEVHQLEWSLDSATAIQIEATIYGIAISILTLILILLNVLKKSK